MKVVHNSVRDLRTAADWLNKAMALEKESDLPGASKAYEAVIRYNIRNEFAYQRLMILYRKQKDTQKELRVLTKGIKAFSEFYQSQRKTVAGPKVARISKAISRAIGLLDEKGRPLYAPEPISRWMKRKDLLEKRISRKK